MIRIQTRVGMAGWTDHRFRGHALYGELLGRTNFAQLMGLALGVEFDERESEMFEEIAVIGTLADPHIWPLKLTRVAGVYGGSTLTGLAAGLLASEGSLLGPGSVGPVAAWFRSLAVRPLPEVTAQVREDLAAKRRLPGFGVPARKIDERVTALTERVIARGRDQHSYWKLYTAIVEETRRRGLEPNFGSAVTAAMLDLGLPPEHITTALCVLLLACYLSNAVEGVEQRPEFFREVPREHLDYRGPARRQSPRCRAPRSR